MENLLAISVKANGNARLRVDKFPPYSTVVEHSQVFRHPVNREIYESVQKILRTMRPLSVIKQDEAYGVERIFTSLDEYQEDKRLGLTPSVIVKKMIARFQEFDNTLNVTAFLEEAEAILWYVAGYLQDQPEVHESVAEYTSNFYSFITEHDVSPLGTFFTYWNDDLRCADVVPFIGYIDGELSVMDISIWNSVSKLRSRLKLAAASTPGLYTFSAGGKKRIELPPSQDIKHYLLHVTPMNYSLQELENIEEAHKQFLCINDMYEYVKENS